MSDPPRSPSSRSPSPHRAPPSPSQAGDADTSPTPAPVLVTGAAGALGRSVVARLVAEGRSVLAVDRDAESLRQVAALHPAGRVLPRAADLTDADQVAAVFTELDATAERASTPPAVAHLVGGFRYAPLADMEEADWSFLWRVNVDASFLVFRQVSRSFRRAGGGSLVAVSAPAALVGEAGVGAYAATKAAVLRLVESLAREMTPFGGRANAVLPGTLDTPANRRGTPDADPTGWVTTEAVAAAIAWLLGPGSEAVNGAAVRVPGPDL